MQEPESGAARPSIVVDGVTKNFGTGAGTTHVLQDLHLRVSSGEFICIVGPSGAGKTTLLRCLAGLLAPTSGSVYLGEQRMTEPLAQIGVVFQDYSRSLMPWMRARDNVAFPLQGRGVPRSERNARAQECLAAVGLPEAARQYPWQLSGGMQQRVAIARALAYDARVLLMDEPFASVDAQTRFDLEDLILDLRRRLGITILFVTHDIDEAVYLADRVIVLSGNPATVIDSISLDFGSDRDQLSTKADPRFAEARGRILTQIRR